MRQLLAIVALSWAGTMLAGCGGALDDDDRPASSSRAPYAFLQGNIELTGNAMDVAIIGRGFLMFQDTSGREVYSRDGALRLDRDGYLTNALGMRLLGKVWDERLARTVGPSVPVQVQLPDGGYPVRTGDGPVEALRGVRLAVNLDASSDVIPAAVPRVNFNDANTYNFSASQTVYDGQGLRLQVTYYFQKNDVNRWSIFASINGVPIDQPNGVAYDPDHHDPDPILEVAFGPDGRLLATSAREAVVRVNDPRVPPTAPVLFPALPFKVSDATQFGASFSIGELMQDGYPWGALIGVAVDGRGLVTHHYSNGQVRRTYQLQLAEFSRPSGLKYMGSNIWSSTAASGDKVVQAPGEGSAGAIVAGALEQLNAGPR
jgi:flagellar hook protein FlgE